MEVAASRDQEDKVYVQHLVKRDEQLVREYIVKQKGHIYISGLAVSDANCPQADGQVLQCYAA